jgi:hypothetical protein
MTTGEELWLRRCNIPLPPCSYRQRWLWLHPAYAAKHHEGTKTVHMKKGGKLSAVEMRERRITAQLNRDSLNGNLRIGSL